LHGAPLKKETFNMPGFDHILFPVDFSQRCRVVRPLVKSFARTFKAKITLMHIVEVRSLVEIAYQIAADIEEAAQRDIKRELATFFDLPDPTIPGGVETAFEIGEPALEIARYAEQNRVDLIMMPTHGHGRFRSLLLGSVLAKVLYEAACPVWTATHTEDPTLPSHAKCENILCAVDLKRGDVTTLHRSVELAGLYHAKLRLVHAVPDAELHPMGFDEKFRSAMRDWARDELAKLQREAETNLEVCVESRAVSDLVRTRNSTHSTYARARVIAEFAASRPASISPSTAEAESKPEEE
jgi:nucleotide-binding universal stress UspA family protein